MLHEIGSIKNNNVDDVTIYENVHTDSKINVVINYF